MSAEKVTQVRPLGAKDGEAPHCRSGPDAQSRQRILMSWIIKHFGWHVRSILCLAGNFTQKKEVIRELRELIPELQS